MTGGAHPRPSRFYLTDRPSEALWLPPEERDWLERDLRGELEAKKKIKPYTILQAFFERRILVLILAYFLALSGGLGNIYWIPTFVKRVTGLPVQTVTSLLLIPGVIGIAAILTNGWHADKTGERRLHAAIPLIAAGLLYGLAIPMRSDHFLATVFLLLGSGCFYGYYPAFWSMPTLLLSETAAAATFGLINSIGQIGGILGPWAVGVLNDRTHSLTAGFGFIALVHLLAGGLMLTVKIRTPANAVSA